MASVLKSTSQAASSTDAKSSEDSQRHSEVTSDLLINSGMTSSAKSMNSVVLVSYVVRLADLINNSTNSLKTNVIEENKISSVEVLDSEQLVKSKENDTAPRKKTVKTKIGCSNLSSGCIKQNISKFQELSSPKNNIKDFFGSLGWYESNKCYFDKRLRLVLDEFESSESYGKEYHNYLLLDSRVVGLTEWSGFIHAVFFVGKGKTQSVFDHCIKEAANGTDTNKKISRILDIWRGEGAVIVLPMAAGLLEYDAQTREALIVEALGKKRLCNNNSGSFYGTAAALTAREKHELGATLLVKARERFLKSGANCVFAPVRLKNNSNAKKEIVRIFAPRSLG